MCIRDRYLRAAHFFHSWLAEGTLKRETQPSVYVYRHEFLDPISGDRKTRQGILGVVGLEPFGTGILPHERTHARAKADRLSLTRAVQANLSPIFALYEDPEAAVGSIIAPSIAKAPRLALTSDDGNRHTVWAVTDSAEFRELASVLTASRLYIADGHHRYETALNFRNKMRLEHPEAPADAAFNSVLTLLVDVSDPGLTILPTHRTVHDVEGFDASALLRALRSRYHVTGHADAAALIRAMLEPPAEHRIGLAVRHESGPRLEKGQGGELRYFTIDIPRTAAADPVSGLDVSVLHREILQPELGLGDEVVEDERHLGYSRDLDAVLGRVEGGSAQAAFVLRPPAVSDVVAVARAGQVMPQKSTYFYPKPASGIVFNPLDPGIQIPTV